MKNSITRFAYVAIAAVAFGSSFAANALGQTSARFGDECPSLRNATLPDLVTFIDGITPSEENGWCVAFAIDKLGQERYEAAIPALVGLLAFERPQTAMEKRGVGSIGSMERFEAQEALEAMGRNAKENVLPAVLGAIEAGASSATARKNAVHVWIYENGGDGSRYPYIKGIALLKQEEMKTTDDAVKQRLQDAVRQAVAERIVPGITTAEAAAAYRQAGETGGVPDSAYNNH